MASQKKKKEIESSRFVKSMADEARNVVFEACHENDNRF
jgi:hypothetical protein